MKSVIFNGLLMAIAIGLIALLVLAMPARRIRPAAETPITYRPIMLSHPSTPLRLAGAWEIEVPDRRFGGLSALTVNDGKFLAVTDRGAVVAFDPPAIGRPTVRIWDLRQGPGPFGKKWARDAESIASDPQGRGWWVGFEQRHSVWLYDGKLSRALAKVTLPALDWGDNGGAEGLTLSEGKLLALGENGRDAILIGPSGLKKMMVDSGAQVADAANAPDGSIWVLLRQPGSGGLAQSVAQLRQTGDGWAIGPAFALPKGPIDNFEGLLIERREEGVWRFWLVSDNDFRSISRTLMVALDYSPPAGHYKSPVTGTGLSNGPAE